MTFYKIVTPDFAVAPQIGMDDVAQAAGEGFVAVINNRPDHETPGQPTSAQMEAAARAAGLDYHWIPIVGGPTPAQADAVTTAARAGKTLAFCRSGTRSINVWAFGQARSGEMGAAELVTLGAKAGYDLSWLGGGR